MEECSVVGLSDGKAGRPGPLKLTEEAIRWALDLHRRRPDLSGREFEELLAQELGIEVHRRTIERLLAASGKRTAEAGGTSSWASRGDKYAER